MLHREETERIERYFLAIVSICLVFLCLYCHYYICHLTMRSAYTNHTIHLHTKRVFGDKMVRDVTWACRLALICIRSPFYHSSLRSQDLFSSLLPSWAGRR